MRAVLKLYVRPNTPRARSRRGVIEVRPQAGESIRLRANLIDHDPALGDDSSGDEIVLAPFETGWRKDVSMVLTGSGSPGPLIDIWETACPRQPVQG